MIELLQITNDPELARRCDALGGFRLFVDLELMGKMERQAGRNTHITSHAVDDVSRIKMVLKNSKLMVRLNPVHAGTADEINAVLARGADMLMCPMFHDAATLHAFAQLVAGRAPIVPLLETKGALESIEQWIDAPGLAEVYVGLNDLHVELGNRFMFEPLAAGYVERVAVLSKARGLRFGFGGIARMGEGLLSGRDVLGEHLRLGSTSVIVSRTFHRSDELTGFEEAITQLRQTEAQLAGRSAAEVAVDHQVAIKKIASIAANMPARA